MEQTIAFIREHGGGGGDGQQCGGGVTASRRDLAAIVGPGKSSTTIAVQNLLQVFRIPQIGYGATTTDLSDKEQFGYFMRVVPSDVWQARAIIEVVKHFNWTYIAVVYSSGKLFIGRPPARQQNQ